MRLTANVRILASLSLVVGAACAVGCNKQESIAHYTAPKSDPPKQLQPAMPHASAAKNGPGRTLAAIVPHGPLAWFFKLTGPKDDVAAHADEFNAFMKSVQFGEEGAPPKWKLPEGWKQQPGTGMRHATIQVPGEDAAAPLELTIITLPRGDASETEYTLSNVNRWRGQLQAKPLTTADLEKETRRLELTGATATLVDIAGMLAPDSSMRPPFAGPMQPGVSQTGPDLPRPVAGGTKVTYTTPEGWGIGRAEGMRKAAFHIAEGDKSADVTIIDLDPSAGDLLANVNRWREQVKLSPVTQAELEKELKPLKHATGEAQFVALVGPEDAKPRQTILGAIAITGGRAWFIKLLGDAELAERERERFEKFVNSVQFPATR